MTCTCPECKNDIDLARYPNIAPEHVIECDTCGMTLEVLEIKGDNVVTDIVDEGK